MSTSVRPHTEHELGIRHSGIAAIAPLRMAGASQLVNQAATEQNSAPQWPGHGAAPTRRTVISPELGDDGAEWTPTKVDTTLSSKKTVEAKFVKPLPVYIVYFSSAALTDGTIVDYQDVYKRDSKVIAALLDRNGDNLEARKANADAAKI